MTENGAMNQVKKILGENKRLFSIDIGETIEWVLDEGAWGLRAGYRGEVPARDGGLEKGIGGNSKIQKGLW